ncbi:4-alpha-glucanotransferase [Nocardioides marinquilinus]|uniref:4-alpha-glucanotransferase n=1 Tax=Nocardioides marinquilinus TaxID=1210400 RepID=A0ABP9PDK5_9ACTN
MIDEYGVQSSWLDSDDQPQHATDETVRRVRELAGRPPADLADTGPVVTRPGRATGLRGEVTCEDGSRFTLDDVVPDDAPLGYHALTTAAGTTRRLVVSPGRCFVPERQSWGWAVQLYAALSSGSAGIGDLADLRTLREWTEAAGGGFLVVNPLHAVAPVTPVESSPYLPATRRFRNPLYLRVDGAAPHRPDVIDRDAVWAEKLGLLRRRFDAEASRPDAAFTAWRAEQGEALERFATWSVLCEEHGGDWRAWPEALRDPASSAVAEAVATRQDDVAFHAWLQWLLAEQLREATGDLTVIQDLPIGVSGGGADAWARQDVLAIGATVGAPPDALNTVGQDWSSPPFVPWRLQAADYEPFVQSVRATIAGAGGLRIDHVMGLFRLWWIPEGSAATDGCYVRYPSDDLLDIVCLESHRAGAVVVGEDLGTVEDGVREALAERGILGYRVLWFEDDEPETWPAGSLAAVTTHDLPTVPGLVTGSDVDDVLAASDMTPDDVRAGRASMLEQLARAGATPADGVDAAVAKVYARLGGAPSLLLALAIEDALGQERRPNVPGTDHTQRDNWSLPLPVPVDRLEEAPGPAAVVAAVTAHRQG